MGTDKVDINIFSQKEYKGMSLYNSVQGCLGALTQDTMHSLIENQLIYGGGTAQEPMKESYTAMKNHTRCGLGYI